MDTNDPREQKEKPPAPTQRRQRPTPDSESAATPPGDVIIHQRRVITQVFPIGHCIGAMANDGTFWILQADMAWRQTQPLPQPPPYVAGSE